MQNPPGIFIVIEGSDGSGKGTQFNLLKARLEAVGHDVEVFDFPRYEEPSSYFVKQYLNGAYGKATAINPYTASLFFALDRYEAAPQIKKALEAGKVVMSNRFVGSNMAHQGAKFNNPAEQRGFFLWEDNLEYELLGIPRPTFNIFLKVPAEISYELIKKKDARSYTNKTHDEHEGDINHLRRAVSTYETLCQLFPNDFKAIDCTANGELMSIAAINDRIWSTIQPTLPAKPAKAAKPMTVNLSEKPAEAKKPSDVKQDSKDASVAEFRGSLSLATITNIDLIQPGLASYSLMWHKNDYRYYVPEDLPKNTQAKYREIMDHLVAQHKAMSDKLKKSRTDLHILNGAVPLAALFNVQIKPDAGAVTAVVNSLQAANNLEITPVVKHFRKILQARAEPMPEAIDNIISRLAKQHLPQHLGAEVEEVQLLEAWPRNEFKVLADTIYPYSSLPHEEIELEIDKWNYQQKQDALVAAVNNADNLAAKQVHYRFDVVLDRSSLVQLKKHGVIDDLSLQPATPRYGYEVPAAIEQAGIDDQYLDCFDSSLELYSMLQAADREDLAVYATLLGHKVRAQVICSYKSLRNLKTLPDKSLAEQFTNKISEVHPILAAQLNAPTKKPKQSARSHRSSRKPKK